MLARPAILTRRALVAGAAALAMAPADLRAANAAGWNPADKHADIALSSIQPWLGNNVVFGNTVNTNTWRSVRSAGSAASGKMMFYFGKYTDGGGDDVSWGIGSSAFDITGSVNGDPNSWGIFSAGQLFHNGSPTGSLSFAFSSETLGAICINMTGARIAARIRDVSTGAVNDTGWIDWTGAAVDPTFQGTDISGLSGSIFAIGSSRNNSGLTRGWANFGGWPPLTDLIPIPAGFSLWDGIYPYVMPTGAFTLSSNTDPSNVLISQNNMRATCVSGASGDAFAYTAAFPTGSKTVHAFYYDKTSHSGLAGHAIVDSISSPTPANCLVWLAGGTTRNIIGTTWGGLNTGFASYMAVDEAAQLAWITQDGITWYGNGGASPNPATGTNGASIAGIGTRGNRAAGLLLNKSIRSAATFNAGRLADPFPLPIGFTWADPTPVQTNAMQRPRIIQ